MTDATDTTDTEVDVNNFKVCLMATLGGKYDANMRRAVQSAVLFQAGDDVDKQYNNLKIFQRKLMVFEAATQIISSLDGIPSEDRKKLLYRTCTGKLMLSPELAWRRLMYTKRETERLVQEVEADPANSDKSHVQICAELAQTAYLKKYKNQRGRCPRGWDLSHMKEFIIYRMFYNRSTLLHFHSVASTHLEYNPNTVLLYTKQLHDSDDFEQKEADDSIDQTPIATQSCSAQQSVGTEQLCTSPLLTEATQVTHQDVSYESYTPQPNYPFTPQPKMVSDASSLTTPQPNYPMTPHTSSLPSSTIVKIENTPLATKTDKVDTELRKKIVHEIKEQLELLKQFEDVISEDELKKKKQELFSSLPVIPSILGKRKSESSDDESSSVAKRESS